MLCLILLQLRFYSPASSTRLLPLLFRLDAQKVRSSSLRFLLSQLPPLSRGWSRCFPATLTRGLFCQTLSFVWRGRSGSLSTHISSISAIKGQSHCRRSRWSVLQTFSAPKTLCSFPPARGFEVLPLSLHRQN